MQCPACGSPVEPGQATCPTCGAPTAGDEFGDPATDIDPPTEIMPAVALSGAAESGAADDFDPDASSDLPTTQVELPPAIDTPAAGEGPSWPAVAAAHEAADPVGETVAIERSARGGSASVAWRQLVVGALVGGAIVLALVIGAWAAGDALPGLLGVAAPGSPAGASVSAEPSAPSSTQQGSGAGTDGFSCTPRQLTAPGSGRWKLYRTEWGSRGNFDYLRLKLRHEGRHEEAATASAEVLAPADVHERYGIEPPAQAEAAVVVAFNGPVGIGGPLHGRGNGPLLEFRVARGREGRVHAVVGVRGQGCFRLTGGGWESGDMKSSTDITLEIQKP